MNLGIILYLYSFVTFIVRRLQWFTYQLKIKLDLRFYLKVASYSLPVMKI